MPELRPGQYPDWWSVRRKALLSTLPGGAFVTVRLFLEWGDPKRSTGDRVDSPPAAGNTSDVTTAEMPGESRPVIVS
jgi:hypothetical protein